MRKYSITIGLIVIILLVCIWYKSYNATSVIDIENCVSVGCINEITDSETIREVADLINSAEKERTPIRESNPNESASAIINFDIYDGSRVSVVMYGEYIYYTGTEYENRQYRLSEVDKFYDELIKYDEKLGLW